MDKDIGLLDEFFINLKKFFLYALALGVTISLVLFCIVVYKNESRPPVMYEEDIVHTKNTKRDCECIRYIVDDMIKSNMTTLTITKVGDYEYNFFHAYENGENVSYTHQWK